MKKILLIDNYDSFTYNLLHLIEKVSEYQVEVFKNDQIEIIIWISALSPSLNTAS